MKKFVKFKKTLKKLKKLKNIKENFEKCIFLIQKNVQNFFKKLETIRFFFLNLKKMSLNAALRRTKGQFLHRRHHPERCPLLLPRIIILFRKKLVSRDGLLDQRLVVLLH